MQSMEYKRQQRPTVWTVCFDPRGRRLYCPYCRFCSISEDYCINMNLSELKVTCPEMLLKLSGVIDIQGFHVNNKFIPRQLAVITKDTITSVIDFKTGINYHELSIHDRRGVKNVQKNIHFLDFEPSVYIKYRPSAEEYFNVLRRVALDLNISRENPIGVNNPQTELMLTAADVPYVTIRNLIPNLPTTDVIIKHYTRTPCTITPASKVSSLWRLILSKQFEISNKATFEYINSRSDTGLENLITESNRTQCDELSKINYTLNQVLGDLMRIRIDIDQGCSPASYTELSQSR
jgi:hypothetical protein